MKKILTIIGARPQFVKAAVLSRLFSASDIIVEKIIHTGQHFDANMSDIFFEQLGMPTPAYNLAINGTSHGRMTGDMLGKLDEIYESEKPDAVLVYGDTNSTLAGALAAVKMHIPVIHVEAGLRSYNRRMPEEINRVMTDHVSDLLFCPTTESVRNLKSEGITKGVKMVGDVMFDATLYAKQSASFSQDLQVTDNFALATIHRAENTSTKEQLSEVLDYLRKASKDNGLEIVLPLHPRTKNAVNNFGLSLEGIQTCEPLGYFEMHGMMSKASLILTDSGGVQKEAYFHSVPCVTLRDETEWVETIDSGWNRLWKGSTEQKATKTNITDYGDGHSGELIYNEICSYLNAKEC